MGKRRRLSIKWGIILVIVGFVIIQTEAYGQSWNWELFSSDLECDFFYDPDTVLRSSENVLRVWWKEVFKTKEVLRSRGYMESEFGKVLYQVNVTEINCQKKESRRKFFMLCSETGESILCNIHRRQIEEWVPVWQVRPTGVLYRKLCR